MFEYLMADFANVFQTINLLLTIFGTVVGVVISCLPGPQFFTQSPNIVYTIFAGMIVIQFVMLAFGFIGYFMKKFGFPGAPMVLGVILGPIAEKNLDRALQLSRNDWTIFFRRPIALTFILLSVGMIAWTIFDNIRRAKAEEK